MIHGQPPQTCFRRLVADEQGATAVVVAISLTALMGFTGLAVDASLWYNDKRLAQGAVDAAAFSGAVDRAAGDSVAGVVANAKAIAAKSGFTDGTSGVVVAVNVPPLTGPNIATTGAVEVIVTKSESLLFSSFFLRTAQIAARAVATAGSSGGKYCVQALDPSSTTGANLNNGATVNVSACGLEADAGGSAALSVTGSSVLTATTVSVAGGTVVNGGGAVNATTKDHATAADPYIGRTVPTPGACTGPASYSSYDQSNNYTGHYVISPGTYCNGFTVSNGVTVTMNPGVYIVNGGAFSLQSGTVIATGGVTIVLTGSGTNYATASIANNMNLRLTAPTSGPTSGLAIFQDPQAPRGGANTVAGGASMNVTGALYFPNQTVNFSNGSSNATACTQLIASDLVFTGGSKFGNNCAGTGVVGIGAAGTTLVE